ncbi:MAG: hypothetical protein RIF32_19150 [Leptospirales bacterium]|jgi:predicted hydrocarbon binding protein
MADGGSRSDDPTAPNSKYADVKDRESLMEGIQAGRRVVFMAYTLSNIVERQLDFVIAVLLKKYGRTELQTTIYSCLKEIVINATKANAKHVFFEENNLKIDAPEEYQKGLAMIKEQLSEAWIEKYGSLAKAKNLRVSIEFDHEPDGLRIWVFNDTELISADEGRIREKLAEGMNYEDLLSFYMQMGDQAEGEGLGLVMNLLLLKGENINPALFRVGFADGKTMARIEIPFTDDFVSIRGDNPEGFRDRDSIRVEFE